MSDKQQFHEDEPTQDDAVIGQAFRWSMFVIIPTVLFVATIAILANRKPAKDEPIIEKNTEDIQSQPASATTVPELKFTDVTGSSGIDFAHNNGATGDKMLPETMGGGVAVIDYNTDGLPDLFFVDSRSWPDAKSQTKSRCRLYENQGGNTFKDVSVQSNVSEIDVYGMGCAVGDIDNDGDPDLFISALGANRLLKNNQGVFEDITKTANTAGQDVWSTSCGFFDYDLDGDLDLFVCNYVEWSRETDFKLNFSMNGSDRAYGPPSNYQGVFPYLYRNNGDATFTEIGEAAGLHVINANSQSPVSKSLAVVFADVDEDGYPDILVANDTVQNHLFHNRKDGTFEDVGSLSGLAFDRDGKATGAMGIDAGFPFSDKRVAIGIGNFANEMTSLYVRQDAALSFADETLAEGIGAASRQRLTFGLVFLDVDLDGRVDLLQTNGHLEEEINEVQPSQTYRQPAQLFWNQGEDAGRCFAIVPKGKTGALAEPIVGRGAAYADFDLDGDLDLILTQTGGPARLLRNDTANDNHWLRIRLTGTASNRDAYGSEVTAELPDGRRMFATASATRSYLSQVESSVTLGLGAAEQISKLSIRWPSGVTTTQENVAANQLLELSEPAGE